jgi:hypothetical protein
MKFALCKQIIFSVNSLFLLVKTSDGFACIKTTTTASSQDPPSIGSTPSDDVQVWDDVLSSELCSAMHEKAKEIGLGHRVFRRSSSNVDETTDPTAKQIILSNNNNLIEQAIDSILIEIGDDSQYVEYWMRQEWR